jgi:hypothetical protein
VDHLPTLQIDDRHCIPCDPFAGTAASKGDRCRHCDRDHQRERHEDGCDRMPARQSDRGWPSCRSRGEPTEPLGRVALLDLGQPGRGASRPQGGRSALRRPRGSAPQGFGGAGSRRAGDLRAGSRSAAETSGQVEGASSVTRLQRDRLSGIEADTDGEREGRIGNRLLQEPSSFRRRRPRPSRLLPRYRSWACAAARIACRAESKAARPRLHEARSLSRRAP